MSDSPTGSSASSLKSVGDVLAQGEVAAAYNRWSAQYDTDRNSTRDLDARVLRRAPLVLDERHVLEIGCGTGKNTEWLAGQARHVTALDFSAGMLAVARKRVPHASVQFVQHDVRDPWPLTNESVDVVLGNLVLEHVEQLAPVYAEAARVLRPGGQLYMCELHPFRQLRGGQAHFVEESSGQLVHVSAFVHTISEYVNLALQSGFVLRQLGEWLEEGAASDAPPRLLSLLFTREAPL